MQIEFKLQKDWVSGTEPQDSACLNLHESEKELLFSGVSMTEHLEELLGAPVEVEARVGKTVRLGPDEAAALGVTANAKAQQREVWLTIQGKKLIYAHTLIPLVSIDSGLLATLKERRDEPIGRVLGSLKIPFQKKEVTIALLTSTELATELGLSPETNFVARRYILYTDSNADSKEPTPAITAAVTEIFNPDIISAKCTVSE